MTVSDARQLVLAALIATGAGIIGGILIGNLIWAHNPPAPAMDGFAMR